MSCVNCNDDPHISGLPPYANADDVQRVIDKFCVECVVTVTSGTLPINFCDIAFDGSKNPACDSLLILEGNNVWWSGDCLKWFLVIDKTSPTVLIPILFYEEELLINTNFFDVQNIPQDGDELLIEIGVRSSGALPSNVSIFLNNDLILANYVGGYHLEYPTPSVSLNTNNIFSFIPDTTYIPTTDYLVGTIKIKDYTVDSKTKGVRFEGVYKSAVASTAVHGYQHWDSLSPVDRVKLNVNNGVYNFVAGSYIKVWKLKRVAIASFSD